VKVNVLGAGPAGLYLSILLKRADQSHEVHVHERNHPDATFGWGVVFSEGSLDELEQADYSSFMAITGACASWNPLDIHYRDRTTRIRGNVFSGVGRARLLNLLQQRALDLGVRLTFERELRSIDSLLDADLVVGADGANSLVRSSFEEHFRPRFEHAASKYAWYGVDYAFPVFSYIFKSTAWGPFQAHCYPFNEAQSTMIVLVSPETWRRAGLDQMDEQASMEVCERVFAEELGGRRMLSNRSLWTDFRWIRCDSWHTGKVVILGDAAHTAHFSIGSGTKLALEDAIALARAFVKHGDRLEPALAEFETERQPVVERLQEASRVSCAYFQCVSRYFYFEPEQFAYQLMTRARITHSNLAIRDPDFVRGVEAWFWNQATGERPFAAPPPAFAPLRLRSLTMPNRLAFPEGWGYPGPGLRLTGMHAVSPDGRTTPETPTEIGSAPAGAISCLRLGHAGRRGATRPHRIGVDLPLRAAPWPQLSASPIPYAPWLPVPREAARLDLEHVCAAFVDAARRAARAGHGMLLLDFALGGLPASFISPLSNRRTDEYGGPLEHRLRFPLEVLRAVRAEWPQELPLAVAYTAADNAPGGLTVKDSVRTAAALHDGGADLLLVLVGQTVVDDRTAYGPLFGVADADRIRNDARVRVIASGRISTLDEVNTILAAGRADICLLSRVRQPRVGPRADSS
jgi:anthraniloyl-CoA monooxygenase